MYYIYLFVILIVNCLYRLQSIMSEILILITLIVSILYSPVHFYPNCKSLVRVLSIKDDLLDQFFYHRLKCKSLEDISKQHCFLKNYYSYQKNEINGVVHIYVVSSLAQTFFQVLSNNKVVDINNDINILINQYPILNNLKLGQVISLVTVKGYGLRSLLWQVSSKESRIYNRVAFSNVFIENIIMKFNVSNNRHYLIIMGRLHDNFINTFCSLGIDRNNIQKMITALQWQLNLRKLHVGDNFSILVLCSYCDNKNIEVINQIVTAIRLCNLRKDYYAFRADNGRFYNREATGVAYDFMKFPTIKPFRISSNFNLNRLNPITGRVSPHFGVDFAVPIGTPILSIGAGEVIISKYGKKSGNYIAIRHGSCCVSRYMHLNRLLVKPGQIVKKGENIAYSGNTGRSTGPHLHFELWVNHKPINPLTATFLSFETLYGSDRVNYISKMDAMLPYLHIST